MAEPYNQLLQRAMALGVKAPTAQQVASAPKVQPTSGLGSVAQTNALLTQASKVTGIPATTFTEAPQTPITLPEPPKDTTNYNAEITYPVPTAPDTNFEDILKQYLGASQDNTQKSAMDTFTGLESQLGIEGKEGEVLAKEQAQTAAKKELDLINAQLQGIQGTLQTDTLKLRGEGISAGAIGGRSINLEREAAIRAIPLQTQALIAQANLDSASGDVQSAQKKLEFAQGRVDTLFSVYSKDAEREWQQKQKLIDVVYDYATKAEQRKLDDKRLRDERAFSERNDLISYGRDLAKAAIENGQAGIASQLMGLDPSSSNYQSDLARLGGMIKQKPIEISAGASLIDPITGRVIATAPAKGTGGGAGQVSSITQAVIDNPNNYNGLTPTVKGQVLAELQKEGYDTSNLGEKGLSDTAIKELSQSQGALSSLNDLRSIVSINSDKLGPIRGLAALNPWAKERQIQADIDRVRQVVGKALEGGVLRKEDEEKYKKILATITDVPETAVYKIDQLIADVTRNVENYKSLQESAGRSLDTGASLQKKGAGATGKTSGGNSYTITK